MIADLVRTLQDAMSCACPVCTRHGEAHQQTQRTILGTTVGVDVAMTPLLDALAAAGVSTVASCIDLADAVEQLRPEQLPVLLTRQNQPGIQYGRVVANRHAFVRVLDTSSAGPFLEAVESVGGEVIRSRPIAQAAFPRWRLQHLASVL